MTPAVSILIPSYNAARWVKQAVESALAQGPNIEVIVVDDGSTDETPEILRTFRNRIRLELGKNRGAPAARNIALEMAKADWVQYLDADDYLLPGKVLTQLAAVKPETDILYGPETIEWHRNDKTHMTWSPLDPPHDPASLLALWKLPQTGGPLWRRSALNDVDGWREDQPCCQEHELYLRLLMKGKRFDYHNGSKGAVYRRFSDGTLSTRNPAKVRAERARIVARLEAWLREINALTDQRQWSINQARFDMARVAWSEDRTEGRRHHRSITSPFLPNGKSAQSHYTTVYRLLGFELAERIAHIRRKLSK